MLFLDGLYVSERGRLRFRRVKAPDKAELESLVHTLSKRVGRYLERQGLPRVIGKVLLSESHICLGQA